MSTNVINKPNYETSRNYILLNSCCSMRRDGHTWQEWQQLAVRNRLNTNLQK